MKQRVFVLALALVLTLSGCSSLLSRSYRSVTPHMAQTSDPAGPEADEALRAETYGELVNDVQFFVAQGESDGVIHVYGYAGDLEADVQQVRQELLERDPLCCWALKDISWERSPLISYEEVRFRFDYRIDPGEIPHIQTAIGSAAIRQALAQTLAQFQQSLLLETSSYYGREDLLLQFIQQAYYAQPGLALGYPQVTLSLYPAEVTGPRVLVEIRLTYPAEPDRLQQQAQRTSAVAATLIGAAPAQGEVGCWLLYSRLSQLNHYAPGGEASVFAALVSGGADSEGMALAYQYLCQQSGMECLLVSGTRDGSPHCWNLVRPNEVWRHVDLTAAHDLQSFLRSDSQMDPRYIWDTEQVPACPDPSDAEP